MAYNIDQVKNNYFEWLYNIVCKNRTNDAVSYKKMFSYMHQKKFIFYIEDDDNRARDGANLRYRYAMIRNDERYF